MSPPKVSIGLPVYNGEKFLGETLEAFLSQTFPDFEILISDNASTDRTEKIGRTYAARDARVRYHRNDHNIGLGRNYNRVFKLARGQYFKWAPADDLCLPDYLRRCVEVLDHDPAVVLVYPQTQFMDAGGKFLDIDDPGWDLRTDEAHERLRYVIRSGHWVNSVVGLIRSRVLARTRLMPTYPGGDYRLLAELSLQGKFVEIPERLFRRRLHAEASSQHGPEGSTPDKDWLARYWKGANGSLTLPTWGLGLDQFRIIVGSNLPLRHKLSLLSSLLRCLRWRRQNLWQELLAIGAVHLGLGGPARKPRPKAVPTPLEV